MKKTLSAIFTVMTLAMIITACSGNTSSPVDRLFESGNDLSANGNFKSLADKFSKNDLNYVLTEHDKHRLIDSLGQDIINEYKAFAKEFEGDPDPDSIVSKELKSCLNSDLSLLAREISDCQTFGEFLIVINDLNGGSVWGINAGFLPSLSEQEVVDQYIAFYIDYSDIQDDKTWPIARCHRAFHQAIYNNIPLSQASRERITDSLSNFAIKNLHAVKAESPDSTGFISDQDCRQNIASDIENCRNFKDLPLLWFIEELSDAEKNIFQVK